jgi:hypothetical protein
MLDVAHHHNITKYHRHHIATCSLSLITITNQSPLVINKGCSAFSNTSNSWHDSILQAPILLQSSIYCQFLCQLLLIDFPAEICALLGCYAASGGNALPPSGDSLSVPSSGVNISDSYHRLRKIPEERSLTPRHTHTPAAVPFLKQLPLFDLL